MHDNLTSLSVSKYIGVQVYLCDNVSSINHFIYSEQNSMYFSTFPSPYNITHTTHYPNLAHLSRASLSLSSSFRSLTLSSSSSYRSPHEEQRRGERGAELGCGFGVLHWLVFNKSLDLCSSSRS